MSSFCSISYIHSTLTQKQMVVYLGQGKLSNRTTIIDEPCPFFDISISTRQLPISSSTQQLCYLPLKPDYHEAKTVSPWLTVKSQYIHVVSGVMKLSLDCKLMKLTTCHQSNGCFPMFDSSSQGYYTLMSSMCHSCSLMQLALPHSTVTLQKYMISVCLASFLLKYCSKHSDKVLNTHTARNISSSKQLAVQISIHCIGAAPSH